VAKLLAKKPDDPLPHRRGRARRPAPLPQRRAGAGPCLRDGCRAGNDRRARVPQRPGHRRPAAHHGHARHRAAAGAAHRPPTAAQRQQSDGRGGMYAVIGFLALIALVVGGIVLFNALSKDKQPSEFAMPDRHQPGAGSTAARRSSTPACSSTRRSSKEPRLPEGTITRTDPVAGTTCCAGRWSPCSTTR
jgi:hypothetical protein